MYDDDEPPTLFPTEPLYERDDPIWIALCSLMVLAVLGGLIALLVWLAK